MQNDIPVMTPKHADGPAAHVSVQRTRRLVLVHHGVGVVCRAGRSLRLVVDLHLVALGGVALALALDPLVLQLVLALALDVDAPVVRELVLVHAVLGLALALGTLDALHLGVLIAGLFAVGLGRVNLLLFGQLLGAVLFLVGDEIGLGLLGRELGGCQGVVIPATTRKSANTPPWQSEVRSRSTYHLMANLVTRGLPASTLRRIFSMTGLAGGSLTSSSLSYSLLT